MFRHQRGLTATLGLIGVLGTLPLAAQNAPRDVPQGHWAYEAVQDLASKGLIEGYPPTGDFFGKRQVTRYEMAVIVQRVIRHLEKRTAEVKPGEAPAGVTKAELDEVRKLIGDFRIELTVIGEDLKKVQEMLGELKTQVESIKRTAEQAAKDAAEAKKDITELKKTVAADQNELKKLRAKHLSGYFQARFDMFEPGNDKLFAPASGSTGSSPGSSGPAVGGPQYGGLIRRARLKYSGPLSARTEATVQLDFSSVGAVALKDAFAQIANLPAPNVALTVGLFPPPFGLELPTSSAQRETPERALGFGDSAAASPIFKTSQATLAGAISPGSVLPLFLNQDRDVGLLFTLHSPRLLNPTTKLSLGVFNGEGRTAGGQRNNNSGVDIVARAQTTLRPQHLDIGLSGYYGSTAVRRGPTVEGVVAPFVNARRALWGADVRYSSPGGTTLRAEYLNGVYEVTPDRARFLAGNHVEAWYATIRHTINPRLEIYAKYDEFNPLANGLSAEGLTGTQLTRKTVQGGLLYRLDEATRLRFSYIRGLTPYDPSAPAGSPFRARLGYLIGEVQVSY